MGLIDAERLDKEGWMLRRVIRIDGDNPIIEQMFPSHYPTIEADIKDRGRIQDEGPEEDISMKGEKRCE